ncbi:MAG: hypothetical protein C5B51_05035 [Terriglobia bacterium]|nr:MAG: hypothetical protein C5B51_05035 [Terriglobia bacterium]
MRRFVPAIAVLAAAGCGYVGEPQPPLANIPARVTDLTAVQRGARLIVQFTAPQLTTEGVTLKPAPELDLRLGPPGEPFQEDNWAAGARKANNGTIEKGAARYEIPTAEWTGKEIVAGVRAIGANGKKSGWSNFVVIPVIAAPETPARLQAENTAAGVQLTWQASGSEFRVLRKYSGESYRLLATVPQPPWIDSTTQYGESYTYEVQTVVKLAENRLAESELSSEVSITPQDRFPPAVPGGLRVLEGPASVELSWDANTEPDFTGYRVYRATSDGQFLRIAEVGLPSYSDRAAGHGNAYRYAVSAVDRVGNESARSAPVEITLQ